MEDLDEFKDTPKKYLFRNKSWVFKNEDIELTNEKKIEVIKNIKVLIRNVTEKKDSCDDKFRYIREMYEKLKNRLESYLDGAKKGIINVKIKDFNNFILDWQRILYFHDEKIKLSVHNN